MARRVRGVLAPEGVQTGDGRVIAAGALEWAPLPLPLAWIRDGDQHINLTEVAPQIGVIETITREGSDIVFTGQIDDANPDGAEMVRRMEAGMGSNGNRQLISIDPDNYTVEIVAMDGGEEGGVIIVASGDGAPPSLRAAAGDPDPGDAAVLLFEDTVDAILERYTRLRIRGATACSVSAFTEAWMELDGEADPVPAAVTASTPVRPSAAWFEIPEPTPEMRGMTDVYGMPAEELLIEQPNGSLGVPLVIADDGRVFGHAALWEQPHTGYPNDWVTAPESGCSYAHFHVGEVHCDDGSRIATGALVVGCDHAGERMGYAEARDHYAHSGLGWADVRASNGELGIWLSGVVRPGLTEVQLRLLRALVPSGDWRRIGGQLEFIAALMVNTPGFPIARESVTAAALQRLPDALVAALSYIADGVQQSLVASGIVYRCPDCQKRASLAAAAKASENEMLGLLHTLERRTRHLVPSAAEQMLARIRS